jgi:hypothetical protein
MQPPSPLPEPGLGCAYKTCMMQPQIVIETRQTGQATRWRVARETGETLATGTCFLNPIDPHPPGKYTPLGAHFTQTRGLQYANNIVMHSPNR